ncbi:hypothetical protein BLNAU_20913 [Blattamonas nauphoetae]|uniref:Uncharacterized protein n=1 Tax=Blattamonas nauphoetae TaxID=2049346 RepID=A0ABQ9WXB9_9EUKA|nr:hypothetical protein BLNAU_20913 [Blattamonas nauphoetae]
MGFTPTFIPLLQVIMNAIDISKLQSEIEQMKAKTAIELSQISDQRTERTNKLTQIDETIKTLKTRLMDPTLLSRPTSLKQGQDPDDSGDSFEVMLKLLHDLREMSQMIAGMMLTKDYLLVVQTYGAAEADANL